MNRNIIIVIILVVVLGLGYMLMSGKSGPVAENGSVVTVHYVGTLEDGTQFDSSELHGGPLRFTLGPIEELNGMGYVIPGWEEGLLGMRKGEKKYLVIPPEKAYRDQQVGPIPPNSTLIFDVEMVDLEPAGELPVSPYFIVAEQEPESSEQSAGAGAVEEGSETGTAEAE